jgi:RND family efflux transporter MFP subunit
MKLARALVPSLGAALVAGAAAGQPPEMPPSPVRYVMALNHDVRPTISLTGSVDSRRSSLVATEVAGVVARLEAREGDRVGRGEPLAGLRSEEIRLRLEAARGQLQEAEARLRLAEAQLARSRGLFDEQIVSQENLDDAVSEAEAWQGRVIQLRAEVARLEIDLRRTTVRAPFAGVVVREHAAEGEWLGIGDPVAEMVDLDDLEVTVEVPESYYAGLARGGTARVVFSSLGGYEIEGAIRAVVPRANPQARTFPVKVALDNAERRIGAGMLARVDLPVGEPQPAVLVPKDAVTAQGREDVVYVVDEGDTVRPVSVKRGAAVGAWVAVEGGVAAGERVVTRGNERLFPGQKVVPEAMEYERP